MATLDTTTTTDYRDTIFAELVTLARFSGDFSLGVYFNSSQFDGIHISKSLTIEAPLNPDNGFGTYFTLPQFNIYLDAASGYLADLRGWTFSGAPARQSLTFIYGGDSNDTVYGSVLQDTVYTGRGSDTVETGAGRDYIMTSDGAGPSVYNGGSGIDYLSLSLTAATQPLRIDISEGGRGRDIGNGTTIRNIEIITVTSGSGNDTITGGSSNDTIDGRGGNDRLDSGTGIDSLDIIRGGIGNDVVISRNETSVGFFSGGDGVDKLIIDRSMGGIAITIDLLTQTDSGLGFTVANDFEVISFKGGFNDDNIAGGNLADQIDGGAGDDILSGRAGCDVILGGAGADVITGGASADTLTGGADADTFVFAGKGTSSKGLQADVITDFEQGADHIDISAVDGLTFIGTDAFGVNPSEAGYRLTKSQTIITVASDANDDGINEFEYNIKLDGVFNLTAADFVF